MNLKSLPKTQKPREKLTELGVANLNNVELLALILGSGTKKYNVLNLAKKILKNYSLKNLLNINLKNLTQIKGIGQIQAGKILAALELGRRVHNKQNLNIIKSSEAAWAISREIHRKSQEHLIALYLNARHELLFKKIISIGNLNSLRIEARDIFAPALKKPACFIILVHNHPSGDVSPSPEDIALTKRLERAAELLGIKILDHVIVSENNFMSVKNA